MDFRTRFPLRLWRPAVDDEVDEELAFHLAMREEELRRAGMTPAQAHRAALDKFGNLAQARHACRALGHRRERQIRIMQYITELRQDVAFAVRQMTATPAFTLLAILTLALGIGATTAIFSAVNAVVLRPLPVPEPDRLVIVREGWREQTSTVAAPMFLEFADDRTAFEAVAASSMASFSLARAEGAERIVGARVTGQYFDVFNVPALLGRTFGVAEDEPGREQVVVLSHRLWTRQFGADRGVVGREVLLNGRPYVVLGVMPASFDFTADAPALWVPSAFTPERKAKLDEHYLDIYARLRPGISIEQAAQPLDAAMRRLIERHPVQMNERWMRAYPIMNEFVGEYRERLYVLLGAVLLVLLIACGNVSNLLLARGASRARELALRSALGAGQGRLVRQLLTESLVLGVLSAAAGIALTQWLIQLLVGFSPAGVPRLEQTRIDGMVLTFGIALAFASSLVFGLVPAWRASRADVTSTLKEAGRGAGGRGTRDVVRSLLIAGEVALALVLLVGAGLLIRSALEIQRVEYGFNPHGVFSSRFLLPQLKYTSPEALLNVTREVESRIARIPGVRSAAVASVVPGLRSFSNGLLAEGAPLKLEYSVQSDGVYVTPNYFETMQLRIVKGRGFTDMDRAGMPLVVILNETAANRMWPGQDPIGKRLSSAHADGLTTVVGVVADVRLGGAAEPVAPTFYGPLAQQERIAWSWTGYSLFVVARTDGDAAALAQPVRRVISDIDPTIALYNVRTMEERMAATLDTARFNTWLMLLLGALGLLLSAVGIYGVIGYFAAQRTSEIGIRMALGATRRDVIRLVVRQAAAPVFVGLLVGAAGATVASQALATQLVNVAPWDPVTFAAVAGVLVVVALTAALIPARRAASIDPTLAMHG